jgi:hypothetical protein
MLAEPKSPREVGALRALLIRPGERRGLKPNEELISV